MILAKSLRFRVAFVFAVFGAALSMVLSGSLYLASKELGHRLMDETLRAELEDSVERYARDSIFVPPNTVSIKGFVLVGDTAQSHTAPPEELKNLAPGSYNVAVGDTDYRVLIEKRDGVRYFMLFDTDSQHEQEAHLLSLLLMFALFMTLASAGGGFWLALRVLTPVTRLAQEVGQADPEETDLSLTKLTRNDEVGELARAFDRYLHRLRDFVEREKYFTADVSHELRTPLAFLLGTAEVLEQDDTLSSRHKERIARIKRATQDMIELTAGLLLMAREHQRSTDETLCHVAEVMRTCVDKHRHLIGERPIRMEIEVIAELDLVVERSLLEIVIGNLIRNALFNTEAGTVLLRLEAQRLTVQDTGIGMRPEVLSRALERHYKGPSSVGAGVGLSLVKRICDRYGWRISLSSQEGQGTTAEINFFPAEQS